MGHLQPDFSNETIVVTGASSGIGRATALDFAQVGATIINGDLRKNPKMGKRPTHELITENDGTAEYVKTDVSNIDDLRELVSRAREYGGVDVMVNNAAIATSGAFREITSEQFNKIHQVNAHGVFFGTQAAANDMIDQKDPGVIINIASISSNLAQYDQTHYDSTKGAIRMITRGSALELSSHGVRVNAVAPGQIATEFSDGWAEQARTLQEHDGFIKPIPLERVGTPEDVVGAVMYLASENSSYVTGELLHVDGGWQAI